MYYSCEEYYKPITVQYYITDCVSWASRLTLLESCTHRNHAHIGIMHTSDSRAYSWNGTCLYVGDLLERWLLGPSFLPALTFTASRLCSNPMHWRWLVGLGTGARTFCPPGCPAGCAAPASPVCNFSNWPGAALCSVRSVRWDHSPCCHGCRFFIFRFISTREYQTLARPSCSEGGERFYVSKSWSIPEPVTSCPPLGALSPLVGAGVSHPQGWEEDRCLQGGNETHLPQLPPKKRREIIGFKMSPFILGGMQPFVKIGNGLKTFLKQGWKY